MGIKVRTISRGIPITSEVLNEHSTAINAIYNDIYSRSNGVTVKRDSTQVTINPINSQFWAEQLPINTGTVKAGDTVSWTTSISPSFSSTPVVTASLVIPTDAKPPIQKAIVQITSISSNSISGIITFPEEVLVSAVVGVSIIAVGQQTTAQAS